MTTPPTILSEQEIEKIRLYISDEIRASKLYQFGGLEAFLAEFPHRFAKALLAEAAAKLAQGVELEATFWHDDETGEVIAASMHGGGASFEALIPLSTAQAAVAAERAKAQALQAKLDALMLEHCPDEMTPEQLETWGKHQRPLSGAEAEAVTRALRKSVTFIDSASPAPAAEPVPNGFANALSIRAANGWGLNGGTVPVLYTDEINGQQVGRDDVWLCTTEALMSSTPSPQPAPTVPADRAGLVEECKRLAGEYATAVGQTVLAETEERSNARLAVATSLVRKLHAAIDRLASSAAQVPEGMALVPLRMNSEMQRVSREDGWQWEDLLAAAGCTEEQCIAASEEPMQAEDVPNSPCAACDGDGRVPSPEECTRCGLRGCWTVECAACGGTGEVAAAPAAGGEQA